MVHLIITGATGTAGSQALRVALADPCIAKITVLTRRPLPPHTAPNPPAAKLTVIEHRDFLSYPPALLDRLEGADGCIWDLGVSTLNQEKYYEVVTKDYAVAAAQAFATIKREDGGGKFVFSYLSGGGASQEGRPWAMFARINGRAESALASLRTIPTLTTYSFRPAGIRPVAPVPEAGFLQRIVGGRFLFPIFSVVLPQYLISSDTLATGMIRAVVNGASGTIAGWEGKGERGDAGVFENEEIKRLADGKAGV